MKRRYPSHLRLHLEDSTSNAPSTDLNHAGSQAGLPSDEVHEVLRAFSKATNWALSERPMQSDLRKGIPGHHFPNQHAMSKRWRLLETIVPVNAIDIDDSTESPSVPMDKAQQLLASIERLVARLDIAEETVRRQEAELATGMGVTSHSDRGRETADRLESILESVARSVGAVAGALYMLDDDTSSLKMRACIGLPKSRLSDPARDLPGSLADLEALLGNAVLLTDIEMMPNWPSPEDFASALVVPVGSTTMPHGTMWFWSDKPRSYSATEVEVANLAAGRVMSEIEQSILGHEVHQSRVMQKQIDTASLIQASMLPDNQILHEDFDVNGWTFQNGSIGGGFHHWDVNHQEMMTISLGNANQPGPEGALVATSIQSIVRTMWQSNNNPVSIMRTVNDTLWGMQDADWTASMGLVQINPVTGYGSICCAGDIQSFVISHRGFRPIGSLGSRVAAQPDTLFNSNRFCLQPGEILLAFTSNILENANGTQLPQQKKKGARSVSYSTLDQNSMLQIVRDMADEKASDIAGFLARTLPTFQRDTFGGTDRSMVLIKNVRKVK
ncbi:MAG: SpoIIE family protein phosphatase [Planctomycetota bacterium]|nr:SpoIIE family protein phosphatase [Planctomycetota bacterium]